MVVTLYPLPGSLVVMATSVPHIPLLCSSSSCKTPSFTLLLALLVALLQAVPSSGCQFPGEVQGVWATQAITDAEDPLASRRQGQVTYSMVTIENNRISGWGECADKRKHHYVLAERSRLGGAACHRCFHLLVVSPNVVVATSRRGGGCQPTVEDAVRSCPEVLNHHLHDFERGESGRESDHRWERDNQAETKEHLEEIRRETQQIMLYKVKSSWGDESVAEVECPISGVFTFTYERGREGALGFRDEGAAHSGGLEKEALCPHPTSEMSNCPYGFGLNILYRDCSYGQPEPVALQCLGGWRGAGGVRHLAVLDTSVRGADTRPKYRCGMYHEESSTGRIHLSFSRDSTCETQLHSPTDGFERYLLTSVPAPPLPQAVQTHRSCRFPRSLEGHWTSVLLDHNTLVFKDQRNLKRYTAVCVDDVGDGEHFIVFTRTHCGDSNYNCLWLKRRSANILEFMLGLYPNETLDSSLCDAGKFGDETSWNTVAKSELESPTRCPLQGSFVGELPDAPGYCARLRSHCSRPHAMTYVVTDCRNATSAYEQREYQCIGEWTEGDRIYALTYRPDTHSHECFVGMKTPDGKMFIKEAGSVSGICGRGVKPEIMGMELVQKADCSSEGVAAAPPPPAEPGLASPRSSATPPRLPQPPARPPWQQRPQKHETSTKPWKPITAAPRWRTSSSPSTSTPGRCWLLACWSCLVTLVTAVICDTLVT